MRKIYLSIISLLIAGIATAVWFAQTPQAVISYGPSELKSSEITSTSSTAREDPSPSVPALRAHAPHTGSTASETEREAPRAEPTPEADGRSAPTCDSVRIIIESATYVPCVSGEMSVLSTMQIAAEDGLSFSGREYPGLGFFIDSINSKTAEDGYYWFLYINDESSSLGASLTHVVSGDVIEWRYKRSY